MTEKGLLKEWQKRLALTDWRIALQTNCDPDEMHVVDSAGCVSWEESSKTALIQIVDPKYYGKRVVPFDFEKTLVHELMHLKSCLFYDNDDELRERIVHQAIDDIARALVDAKRLKPPEGKEADENV